MTPFTTKPDEDCEFEYPKPGKSTILFELIEGETYLWTRRNEENRSVPVGLEIDEIQYEGGSAEIEADQGMLDVAIYDLLADNEICNPGWWVIEGFYGHYTRGDGWETDVHVDFECDVIRPALPSDLEHFGVGVS